MRDKIVRKEKEKRLIKSPLLKGSLKGCILKTIGWEPTYASAVIGKLRGKGIAELTERMIYPFLLRPERQGYISSEYRDSAVGPKRKYYSIPPSGRLYLSEFEREYRALDKIIVNIPENKENG